jgi:hypothetical protein
MMPESEIKKLLEKYDMGGRRKWLRYILR